MNKCQLKCYIEDAGDEVRFGILVLVELIAL